MVDICIETSDTGRIFQRIIETLPTPVKHGNMQFLAPSMRENYASLTRQSYCTGRIIQGMGTFVIQTLRPTSDIDASEPEREIVYDTDSIFNNLDRVLDNLLEDRKTQVVKVNIGHHASGVQGFQALKESLFPRLNQAGYQLELGELTLAVEGNHDFYGSAYTNSIIWVNKKGAFLNIGPEFNPSTKLVLIEWFGAVKRYLS